MNVVVTGATKGIGRAIAGKFAAEGYSIIACSRTESDLQHLAVDFAEQFRAIQVRTFVADIGNVAQVKSFAKWITDMHLEIDILVNNAGYFIPGTIAGEEEQTLVKMMETNVYGAYHLTRALLPSMMERKKGHIFNICSVASFTPFENVGSYGISKFALYGLTKILREEMKPHNVKVTAVCPGATFTASWKDSGIDPDRILEAEDIAKMIFASSQLSSNAAVEDIIIRPQLGDV